MQLDLLCAFSWLTSKFWVCGVGWGRRLELGELRPVLANFRYSTMDINFLLFDLWSCLQLVNTTVSGCIDVTCSFVWWTFCVLTRRSHKVGFFVCSTGRFMFAGSTCTAYPELAYVSARPFVQFVCVHREPLVDGILLYKTRGKRYLHDIPVSHSKMFPEDIQRFKNSCDTCAVFS